jgi:hypothetical protein
MQDKELKTFRLCFGNENGLDLEQKGKPFKEICGPQNLMQVNYRGIANKTCLDTDKYNVK